MWGRFGFWFMVTAVFFGFWDTVLSNQDGFGRMFANGTRQLLPERLLSHGWANDAVLQRVFVVVLITILPIILYVAVGEPFALLKLAGAIEAAHIPIVAGLTLFLNHRMLPAALRPSWSTTVATSLAAFFFAAIAIFFIIQLVGCSFRSWVR